jgi:putative ABC transport system permease protein
MPRWIDNLVQDLRYGVRMLVKSPGSTAVGIVALMLGIGANTAIFTVINAILLRPLPYADSDHSVAVFETKRDKGIRRQLVSPLDFESYKNRNHSFDGIAAIRNQPFILSGRDLPERIEGAYVSPSVFQILGMRPVLGRAFTSIEDQPRENDRVIIGEGLWRRRFASDPNILGSALTLDAKTYTLVGVAPANFHLVESLSEVWVPYTPNPDELTPAQQGLLALQVLAHLKPGISRRQAEADMQAIARHLADDNPRYKAGYGAEIVPLQEVVVGNVGATLWTLSAAVTFVLLIACANVANLLLARAGSRQKEIAVRSSLGANPSRIVHQMLTESVLLALVGGSLGLLLGYWATGAIVKLAPPSIPRIQEISVDWRVLAFTLLVSLATGIVFGLAPAFAALRPDLNSVLRGSGRGNTSSVGQGRMRDIMVVSEMACCVALLAVAGLLIRNFARLEKVDPGFRTDHVLTMQIALPPTQYSGFKIARFYKSLLERVRGLPGVQEAGVCRFLPLSGTDISLNFRIEGEPVLSAADQPRAKFRAASAGYFTAIGTPLIRGRLLDSTDGEHTPKVVVINQAAARRYWPNQDPIGRRIVSGTDKNVWSTIIGVVGDVKHAGLDIETSPETYYQYLQIPEDAMSIAESPMFLVIRTGADPLALVPSIRSEVRALDANQPVFNVRTMAQVVEASIAQPRFRMMLLAIFAGLALLLAAIGLYGVMAYSVTQRTNELGVRMALGARPIELGSLVVGHGVRMTAVGVAIGLVLAAGGSWIVSRLLFGVHALDLLSFAAACLLTVVVAIVASSVPAIRASRVAPAVALRAE